MGSSVGLCNITPKLTSYRTLSPSAAIDKLDFFILWPELKVSMSPSFKMMLKELFLFQNLREVTRIYNFRFVETYLTSVNRPARRRLFPRPGEVPIEVALPAKRNPIIFLILIIV